MRVVMLLHRTVVHDSRVRREAQALVEAGHEVIIAELAEIDFTIAPEGFRRVSTLPPGWVRRRLPTVVYRAVFFATFVRGVLALRPDVVHAHDAAMLLPGLVAARLTGARLVYDSHELATSVPYRDRMWARFVSAIERIAVPRADAVITVSPGIADRLREIYGLRDRPAVLRNVTSLAPPDPARRGGLRALAGVGDEPLVLHQGATAPSRGCEALIHAVSLSADEVRLVFLGDGAPGYEEQLRGLAARLGVGDRVAFVGSMPLEGLLDWTQDADVGVTLLEDSCENHRLALPNKLFEYIAAGVPVVASRLPEMSRIVSEYRIGWTADPEVPASLADAIATALREREGTVDGLAVAGRELRWDVERKALLDVYAALADRAA